MELQVRPIVLAGGRGERLRPRTDHVPKPLLPIAGRPILWYVLQGLRGCNCLQPVVVVGYKGEIIESYFEGEDVAFDYASGCAMAEAFLRIAEKDDDADGFIGLSADTLWPPDTIANAVRRVAEDPSINTVVLTELPHPGHKHWRYVIQDDQLGDVIREEERTGFERLFLYLTRSSVKKVRQFLPNPVVPDMLDSSLHPYQSGWTLLLKSLVLLEVPVAARIESVPIVNINVADDFCRAERFVSSGWSTETVAPSNDL